MSNQGLERIVCGQRVELDGAQLCTAAQVVDADEGLLISRGNQADCRFEVQGLDAVEALRPGLTAGSVRFTSFSSWMDRAS